jgi:hypothetical protein
MFILTTFLDRFNKKLTKTSKSLIIFLISIIGVLFHFPSRFDFDNSQFNIQKQKSNHLLENAFLDHGKGSHTAKLETRIMIPSLIRVFQLNKLSLIVLSLSSGVLFLLALYLYLLDRTEQLSAFWLTLAFSFTYIGAAGFVETRFIFDAFSLMLVSFGFLAIRKGSQLSITAIPLYFFAIINDERSIFTIVGFLLVAKITEPKILSRVLIISFSTLLLYLYFRLLLKYYFKVVTPMDGVGMGIFIDQMNNIRMGLLMFGEGLWILVGLWFLSSKNTSKWDIFLVGIYLLSIFLSFTVVDIGRSTIYWFPILFLGLASLMKFEIKKRRNYIYSIFMICLLIPTYYVSGKKSVWNTFTVFEQVSRMIIGKY